ncbi:MAG TPA: prepilin-type N-terminal cleavage/methylation domain-containing protein [Solirubrobacterales bacterium]|jgi:prepilin-type N-terminal cleavage/methylation domain-containing protein
MGPSRESQGGFTVIEVLVAVLILAIGAMTTFALLSAATRNGQRAKATQVALEFAEQELEFLRSVESKKLALTATPPPSTNPLSPNFRVSEGRFALTRQPVGNYRNLVYNTSSLEGGGEVKEGVVNPGPEPFTNGDVSGNVYRYVVWRNDEGCGAACPGRQDYKQIVVAVKLNTIPSQPAETGYVEVQSNFIDPTDSAANDPKAGPGGKVVTAQQFFLSDTPCSVTGVTVRQPSAGDHQLHNTRGTCASGLQFGSLVKGAPDALLLGSPPDPTPEDPTDPPLYDYSSDFYSERGLQIVKDTAIGCNIEPKGTNPEAQVHRWVTDPMVENFVMTEKATLEFFTRTFPEALYTGRLCVYMFKRHEVGAVATDTPLFNTPSGTPSWTFTPEKNEPWPQVWTNERLTMPFMGSPYTIPKDDRLGLALTVERNNTQGGAIPIMYDNPRYPSRLEVDTSTPIGGE